MPAAVTAEVFGLQLLCQRYSNDFEAIVQNCRLPAPPFKGINYQAIYFLTILLGNIYAEL